MAHGRIRPWMEPWITMFTHMHGSTPKTELLDIEKFTSLIKTIQPMVKNATGTVGLTDAQIAKMFIAIDLDGDGELSMKELDVASTQIRLATEIRQKATLDMPWCNQEYTSTHIWN